MFCEALALKAWFRQLHLTFKRSRSEWYSKYLPSSCRCWRKLCGPVGTYSYLTPHLQRSSIQRRRLLINQTIELLVINRIRAIYFPKYFISDNYQCNIWLWAGFCSKSLLAQFIKFFCKWPYYKWTYIIIFS